MEYNLLQGYLYLSHFSSISDLRFSKLLQQFGSLQSILNASSDELTVFGIARNLQKELIDLQCKALNCSGVRKSLEWASKEQHSIICYEDKSYPPLLRQIDHAPPVLYISGNAALLKQIQIAIVGSRKASYYGKTSAYWMARELANTNFAITSGMALGIDSKAHEGALDVNGSTLAVVGTGIDQCYPRQNLTLKRRIEEQGAVVSEFPLGMKPLAHNFPRRNRIISGMSLGLLVVEAAARSGSLISARLAMEQNREVFALPGQINSHQSQGCHRLIKDGAKLVQSPEDIIEEFPAIEQTIRASAQTAPTKPFRELKLEAKDRRIIDALKSGPCLLEALSSQTKLDHSDLIDRLMELEAAGTISLEAGRYTYKANELLSIDPALNLE